MLPNAVCTYLDLQTQYTISVCVCVCVCVCETYHNVSQYVKIHNAMQLTPSLTTGMLLQVLCEQCKPLPSDCQFWTHTHTQSSTKGKKQTFGSVAKALAN